MRFSSSAAYIAAHPPRTGFESGKKINPCPHLTQNAITGCHGEKEKARDGGKLLQSRIAVMPAKAPRADATVTPEDRSRGSRKNDCASDAEHAQAG